MQRRHSPWNGKLVHRVLCRCRISAGEASDMVRMMTLTDSSGLGCERNITGRAIKQGQILSEEVVDISAERVIDDIRRYCPFPW